MRLFTNSTNLGSLGTWEGKLKTHFDRLVDLLRRPVYKHPGRLSRKYEVQEGGAVAVQNSYEPMFHQRNPLRSR